MTTKPLSQIQIIEIVNSLSEEDKKLLVELAKKDHGIIIFCLKKILRARSAFYCGNKALWDKIQREDQKSFEFFLREMDDQKNVIRIRKELKIL